MRIVKNQSRFKKGLIKGLICFAVIKLMFLCFSGLLSLPIFQVFSIEWDLANDLSINDLYYRIQSQDDRISTRLVRDKKVVLINTGSLDQTGDNFRDELAELIYKLQLHSPKVVGIDHTFKVFDTRADSALLKAISSFDNIVVATDTNVETSTLISFETHQGIVNFPPQQSSIRYYSGNPKTFAAKISQFYREDLNFPGDEPKIPINYTCLNDGLSYFNDLNSDEFISNFKYIEASDFLVNKFNSPLLDSLVKNKIVLLGHLGGSCSDLSNDNRDKFKVPCDTENFSNRERIMSGAVIHANIIENILHPTDKFYHIHGVWYDFVINLLLLLYVVFLVVSKKGKVFNVIFLFIATLPAVFLVLILMEFNIYMTMGLTLLELLIIEELLEVIDTRIEKVLTKINWYEKIK